MPVETKGPELIKFILGHGVPSFVNIFSICARKSRGALTASEKDHQNESDTLLRQGQTLMKRIQGELNDGLMENSNKILAMLVKLLETECKLFKADKQTGTDTYGVKEQIMKFCGLKKGEKLDIKEATKKLTMSFKKEIPKMIEDMKKAETTVERSIDGGDGTLAGPPSITLRAHVNLLRLINPKMEPGPAKDAIENVLNKTNTVPLHKGRSTVAIMPSDLMKLTMELWMKVVKNIVEKGQEQKPFQTQRSQTKHRRSRRNPFARQTESEMRLLMFIMCIFAFVFIGDRAIRGANVTALLAGIATMWFINRLHHQYDNPVTKQSHATTNIVINDLIGWANQLLNRTSHGNNNINNGQGMYNQQVPTWADVQHATTTAAGSNFPPPPADSERSPPTSFAAQPVESRNRTMPSGNGINNNNNGRHGTAVDLRYSSRDGLDHPRVVTANFHYSSRNVLDSQNANGMPDGNNDDFIRSGPNTGPSNGSATGINTNLADERTRTPDGDNMTENNAENGVNSSPRLCNWCRTHTHDSSSCNSSDSEEGCIENDSMPESSNRKGINGDEKDSTRKGSEHRHSTSEDNKSSDEKDDSTPHRHTNDEKSDEDDEDAETDPERCPGVTEPERNAYGGAVEFVSNSFWMLIKIGLFLFVSIKLLFFGIIDEVSSCAVEMHDFGCCFEGYFLYDCPGAYKPDCNMFGHNCVGCRYVFEPYECTRHRVACSCYYCCEPQYAESCPDGCAECIKDGEGGCPQNSGKFFKSLGNSSSSMLASVAKAREHFDMIDVDKNGSISLRNVAAKNVSWFAELDRNGNNQIEPGEFDRSLIGVVNNNNQTIG
uniref:EF-hand domain-containing protein n=1 Tax=Globodera rostochiensis TaxID=31243 RepID=A0A914HU12_GLORO